MHYFSGKGCSEFLESMHYCIGILRLTKAKSKEVWRAVEAIIIEELLAGNEFYMRGILSM